MLVTEVRGGQSLKSVQNREDYLTSAIFGHLRYLPPDLFWPSLFDNAQSSGTSGSLSDYLRKNRINVASYGSLDVSFWPWKAKCKGRPDMILDFTAKRRRTLQIIMEIKLWATKGGKGKRSRETQLARYMRLLKPQRKNIFPVLIYLTPQDARCQKDLEDTFATYPKLEDRRDRVFRLHWYDVAKVAKAEKDRVDHPYNMILGDVTEFLHRRELDFAEQPKPGKPQPTEFRPPSVDDAGPYFVIDVMRT